jgi:glycosyltransferase involved in cell wall biosynthesis
MMPAYNAGRHIQQAIGSLLSQCYSHWELIVVNDGSTDQTSNIVRTYQDPRIRIFDQPNSGEAAARNTALRQMKGEFVGFLDADDMYCPGHLKEAISLLLQHPSIHATYCDGHYCDEVGARIQTLSSRRPRPSDGDIFDEVVRTSSMLGPPVCVVLRRGLVMEHELKFDDAITIGPDWDFFTRYAEVGRFMYINQPTCLYRLHAANISASISLARRAEDLAKCRRKAVKCRRFSGCSMRTRVEVFYDLLVNLLLGKAEEQTEITFWKAFTDLPVKEQARLLRLMATKTLLYTNDMSRVADWLQRSRLLNPHDLRTAAVLLLHSVSPGLCRLGLLIRTMREADPRGIPPFADLKRPTQGPSLHAHRTLS